LPLNISETVKRVIGYVPKDLQLEMAYGELNGQVTKTPRET